MTVGIPLLGRSGRRERQAIGNFTNVLPFVYEPDGADNMREMYRKVSAEMYALLRHQRYPSELLEHLIPEEKRGGSDLYSVCINEYHTELPRRMCGYQVTNTELYNGFQEYALQIIIRRWDGGMNLEFDYRLDVFSDEDIDRLYRIMMLLSEQVMLPELKVSHTQLLSPQEWKADVESGQTAERAYPKKSFPLLFRETAEAHPLWLALSSRRYELELCGAGRAGRAGSGIFTVLRSTAGDRDRTASASYDPGSNPAAGSSALRWCDASTGPRHACRQAEGAARGFRRSVSHRRCVGCSMADARTRCVVSVRTEGSRHGRVPAPDR